MEDISVKSNIVYKQIDSIELRLDVYFPAKKLGVEPWEAISTDHKPTLIYFHGGGWIEGDRISRFLGLLPYLEKGWCVVNVDYRLLSDTHLIDCLNDCIDAINWVDEHTGTYKFDRNQLYLSGESAGGHLALLAGMITEQDIDGLRIHSKQFEIQGIINWYGMTDIEDAIAFWNDEAYTAMINEKWPGERETYYRLTSPIHQISHRTPPIISIHGDADINVDIGQALSFHQQLDAQQFKNKLIQIPGKKHGDFSAQELELIFQDIWDFFD